MKGVSFAGNRRIRMIEVDDPAPGVGEVVLQIRASGLCGSDLHFYRSASGRSGLATPDSEGDPIIAGHEPCGVVVEVGAGVAPHEARVGDRMMVHHYWGCNACRHCRSGWTQMCSEVPIEIFGVNTHGGHAPYMKVPAGALVPLPDDLSFEVGAAIGCGTGTAYYALRRLGLTGEDTIAIFGQGPVGVAATQLATAQGARVIALDIDAERREQALAFGATAALDAAAPTVIEELRDMTRGGAAVALDTSGSSDARTLAIRSVASWGKVALVGVGGNLDVPITDMFRRQVTVFTSWTFPNTGQADCARFIAERGIDAGAVFSHRWSLDQAEEAYRLFDARKTGKSVFVF